MWLGVRRSLWLALAALAGVVGVVLGGQSEPPAKAPREVAPASEPRRFSLDGPARTRIRIRGSGEYVVNGPAAMQPTAAPAATPAPEPPPPPPPVAAPTAPAPARIRSHGELASLEREASSLAESSGVVAAVEIEALLAALPRRAGEPEAERERRLDLERERILADELIVRYRLVEVYESSLYPERYPVDMHVVDPERTRVAQLSEDERVAVLNEILDGWTPVRASPRFEWIPQGDEETDGS